MSSKKTQFPAGNYDIAVFICAHLIKKSLRHDLKVAYARTRRKCESLTASLHWKTCVYTEFFLLLTQQTVNRSAFGEQEHWQHLSQHFCWHSAALFSDIYSIRIRDVLRAARRFTVYGPKFSLLWIYKTIEIFNKPSLTDRQWERQESCFDTSDITIFITKDFIISLSVNYWNDVDCLFFLRQLIWSHYNLNSN